MKNLKGSSRIVYLDNIRIFLTMLVVAHHWAISNGAPGDTYFVENSLGPVQTLLMSMFVATNQAFFMGFFFFISAYFIPSSFTKKGGLTFLKERIIRLGIPLLFFTFVISPVLIFLVRRFQDNYNGTFAEFVATKDGFSVGPLWFVALLMIFSFAYWWFTLLFKKYSPGGALNTIKRKYQLMLFVLLVLITYLIRVYYPVGKWIPVIGIQPAHLMQYILCFSLGIWASQNKALERINPRRSKHWFIFAQILIFIAFPLLFILGGAEHSSLPFMGGLTWQSLAFVLWEQFVALGLIIGLLGIFKVSFNRQNNWQRDLSQNTYAIYVLHALVLSTFSIIFMAYEGHTFQKFILLLPLTLLFSYLLAKFVRRITIVKRIL